MQHNEIKGFTDQSEKNKAYVNVNKEIEERLYRIIDDMKAQGEFDQRLIAVAFTQFQGAFMFLNRAIFQPQRIELPEDKAAAEASPMPPVHVGKVFKQFHSVFNREVVTDERGNELEALGPHWYDKNALERWRNPEAVPVPAMPLEAEETTSSSD